MKEKYNAFLNVISFVCQMAGCFVINTHGTDPIVMWAAESDWEIHSFLPMVKGKVDCYQWVCYLSTYT